MMIVKFYNRLVYQPLKTGGINLDNNECADRSTVSGAQQENEISRSFTGNNTLVWTMMSIVEVWKESRTLFQVYKFIVLQYNTENLSINKL